MREPIQVLLIDDHRMFSDALELLLRGEEALTMIGAAGDAEEALDMCRSRCPDVVLMDIDLPGMDGIQATRRVKKLCPQAQVVIITALQQPDLISSAIEAGACGYVPKTHAADELVSVIKRAAEGDMILPSGEIGAILERLQQARRVRSEAEQLLGLLSAREIQILQVLSEGKSTPEVA
jgi:DNA-binding NarL/FixJ family response regulator